MELSKSRNRLPQIDDFKVEKLPEFLQKVVDTKIELNQTERMCLTDQKYKMIREIDNDQLKNMVFIVISGALRAMNSKMNSDDIVLLVNDFIFELDTYFKHISIAEFKTIVEKGVRKKYNSFSETIGVSIVNFNVWYEAWLIEKQKSMISINNKMTKSNSDRQLPPAKVNWQQIRSLIKTELKNVGLDSKNCFKLSSNYIYDQLVKFDCFGQLEYKNEIDNVQLETNQFKRNKLGVLIGDALEQFEDNTEREAKRLTVINWVKRNYEKFTINK
jgi:hypothetical protein